MILSKVRPSLFLVSVSTPLLSGNMANSEQPAVMCGWACVSACSGATRNYHDLLVIRFFLGFVEAPFFRKILPLLF